MYGFEEVRQGISNFAAALVASGLKKQRTVNNIEAAFEGAPKFS